MMIRTVTRPDQDHLIIESVLSTCTFIVILTLFHNKRGVMFSEVELRLRVVRLLLLLLK